MFAKLEKLNPDSIGTVCLVSIIGVMALTPLMILPMYVLAYRDVLGFDPDTAGLLTSAALAGIAIMTLIVSLKAKTWNLAKVTMYGMLTVLAFNILMVNFQSVTALAILGFLGGLGGGAAQAAAAAVLARTKQPEKAFGIYIFWQFALPAIAFYWFARLLFSETGLWGTFVGLDAMLAVIIVLDVVALAVTGVMAAYKIPRSDADEDTIELHLILRPVAILSLLALTIYGAANAAIWAYAEGIGLDAVAIMEWDELTAISNVGDILAYITAVSVIGPIVVTLITDRYGHYTPLTIGVALQVLSMYVLITVVTPTGYIIGIGLFSIAWAFTWPFFLSIQASFDKTGSVVSAGQFTNLLGNAMGPAMAATFVGAGGYYAGAVWMAVVLFIIVLIPVFLIRMVLRRQQSAPAS